MIRDSNQRLRILVVVAHPHDFTHGAGTCGIHASRGDAVTVVTMTNGSLTHNERLHDELMKPESERDQEALNQPVDEYAEKKAAEFREVCHLFGVDDVHVQSWPQPFRLERTPGAVDKLVEIILETRPHVLITQRLYYSGPHGMASMARDDHNETAIAVTEAKNLAATPDYARQFRPHTIAATYYLGVYFMRDEIDFLSISPIGTNSGCRRKPSLKARVIPRPSLGNASTPRLAIGDGTLARVTLKGSFAPNRICCPPWSSRNLRC